MSDDVEDPRAIAAVKRIQDAILGNSIFMMMDTGITSWDEGKLRQRVKLSGDGNPSVFMASVILQMLDLVTSGKLKGVTPRRVRVVITDD